MKEEKEDEDGDLLSADGGAVVGVCAVSALKPVSVGGGRAAGEPSGQPGVAPPLPAGPWSCGRPSRHLRCRGAAAAVMDGEGQRLAVVVVLLRRVRAGCARATLLPQVLVLLADTVQLALQLLDAPPLGLQELGLAFDDVVKLQEILHRPVRAFSAVLHGGPLFVHQPRPGFDPGGAEIHPSPPALMSGGEGRTNNNSSEG